MHLQPLSGVMQRDRRNRFLFALILIKRRLMGVNRNRIFAREMASPVSMVLLIFRIKREIERENLY